jgi:hypothetical protein
LAVSDYHGTAHSKRSDCVSCLPVEPEPAIVGSATEAELHITGEPFYPWDKAPEGTVAAAYAENHIAWWYGILLRGDAFYAEVVDSIPASTASLNGCPWERSLRVNPLFGKGKA